MPFKIPSGRTDRETPAPDPAALRARTGGKDAPFGGGRAAPHLTPIFWPGWWDGVKPPPHPL